MIVILHNLSFQLLTPHLDVLLEKIYYEDNDVHEKSLWIILNDYKFPYTLNNTSLTIYKFS